MPNLFQLSFLAFLIANVALAQPLILEQELVTDYSEMSAYSKIIEESSNGPKWKASAAFIDDIDIHRITYLSDGLKVKGYILSPKAEGKYPCIIYNRGGNRDFGSISLQSAVFHLGKIAQEGFVIIASQYRGNMGGEGIEEFGGAEVNDILVLPKVLEEFPKADTNRIGMYGWSRGGMMSYLALTKMEELKAVAVGGAVADCFTNIENRPKMESGVYAELIPDYQQSKPQALTDRSAVMWVDQFPVDVPILLMHGTADWRVKPEHSLRMAMEFEKYRIPYRLIMYEGADHGISEHKTEVHEEVISWFKRYLTMGEAIPNMEYHGR